MSHLGPYYRPSKPPGNKIHAAHQRAKGPLNELPNPEDVQTPAHALASWPCACVAPRCSDITTWLRMTSRGLAPRNAHVWNHADMHCLCQMGGETQSKSNASKGILREEPTPTRGVTCRLLGGKKEQPENVWPGVQGKE